MSIPYFSHLKKFDWILFGSVLVLIALGLVVLYSTSLSGGGSARDLSVFQRQLVFAAIGVCTSLFVASFNYRTLSSLSKALYVFSIGLLGAVLLFGTTVRGARGWFRFGSFSIQPVEIVKFFLVVYLAKLFSDYARDAGSVKRLLVSGSAFTAIFLLVIAQPDFGSAFLFLIIWGVMLLISGIRRSHLLIAGALFVGAAVIAWTVLFKPYQKERISVFWDPSLDPLGKGYNVTQSIIAVGSGGVWGKGLGFGSQSQLRFLPERQTDFIFAVIAEELGFLGVAFLCAVFCIFFFQCYRIAMRAGDDFTLFLTLGIAASFAAEVFVNIGGNVRLLPVTGITLPFVSYGGSSLLSKLFMVGVLESIAIRVEQ